MERMSFTLRFMFEDKDLSKALKLHRLLREYGVVGNIQNHQKDESLNKKDRLEKLMNILSPGRIYSTGELWRLCKNGSVKTIQRDLNTLVIHGRIKGFRQQGYIKKFGKSGNTIFWSRSENG